MSTNEVIKALYCSSVPEYREIQNRYEKAYDKAGNEALYIGGVSLIASLGYWLVTTFIL